MDNYISNLLQNESSISNYEIENLENSLLVLARKINILPEDKSIRVDFSQEELTELGLGRYSRTDSGIIITFW